MKSIDLLDGVGRKCGMIGRANKVNLAADAVEGHGQAGSRKPSARRRKQNFWSHGCTLKGSFGAEKL